MGAVASSAVKINSTIRGGTEECARAEVATVRDSGRLRVGGIGIRVVPVGIRSVL
jgi:hypothetical protein